MLWRHRKQTFAKKDLGKIPDRFDPIGFSAKMWAVYNKHEVRLLRINIASVTLKLEHSLGKTTFLFMNYHNI